MLVDVSIFRIDHKDGLQPARSQITVGNLTSDRHDIVAQFSWSDQFRARDFIHQALADFGERRIIAEASASKRPTSDLSRWIFGSRAEGLLGIVVISFPFQLLRKWLKLQNGILQAGHVSVL